MVASMSARTSACCGATMPASCWRRRPATPSTLGRRARASRCASTTAPGAASKRRWGAPTSAAPAKRFEAAQAVFKSKDAKALPALETALQRETDAGIKRALAEARAAVVLNTPDAKDSDKIAAVAIIRARGDQDARALLAGL